MNARSIGIALVCNLLGSAWAQVPAASSDGRSAIGEVKIQAGNFSEARNNAVNEAMRSIVTEEALTFLSPDAATRSRDLVLARVATPPRRFIQDYKLVRETPSSGSLQVEVRAVPLRDKIREEMLRWGILFDRAHRPKFGVLMLQEQSDRTSAKHTPSQKWTRLLTSKLRSLGYSAEEVKSGSRASAAIFDISVWGSLQTKANNAMRANLQAAIEKPTTKLLAMQEEFSLSDADDLVASEMATLLLEKALPAWFVQSGEGRVFDVTIDGLTSNKSYKEILDALNSGKGGFSSGFERMYAPGSVTFAAVYDGTLKDLAEAILKLPLSVKLKPIEARGMSVRFQTK